MYVAKYRPTLNLLISTISGERAACVEMCRGTYWEYWRIFVGPCGDGIGIVVVSSGVEFCRGVSSGAVRLTRAGLLSSSSSVLSYRIISLMPSCSGARGAMITVIVRVTKVRLLAWDDGSNRRNGGLFDFVLDSTRLTGSILTTLFLLARCFFFSYYHCCILLCVFWSAIDAGGSVSSYYCCRRHCRRLSLGFCSGLLLWFRLIIRLGRFDPA